MSAWACTVAVPAVAQDWGRVGVRGAVIESACAIGTAARDQAVEWGRSVDGRQRQAQLVSSPLLLRLVGCALSKPGVERRAAQYFQMTFEGRAHDGVFVVGSGRQQVAIQIADNEGRIANPGEPVPRDVFIPQDRVLNYSMSRVNAGPQAVAERGASVLRFRLDYF